MRVRLVVALLLVLLALGAFNYLRPIPAVSPAHLLRTSDVVPGTAPGLPWPSRGSAAVGVSGLGLLASSGNAQTFPAASITKVMTALVILADKPLKSNEGGPTVTLTEADVQSYQADLAGGQSVAKVEAGEQLSELQLLQGMLIPSANNYAESAARWDAGSLGAFIARMNDRAAKLKLAHTKFADVSGASPASVSTPADLLALGMEAMRDPVFAEIVATPQVDLPVAGTVYNVDAVLGQSGIVGIKTGSGLNTGANFLFAAKATVDGHEIVIFGCVMGQSSLAIAFANAKKLIAATSLPSMCAGSSRGMRRWPHTRRRGGRSRTWSPPMTSTSSSGRAWWCASAWTPSRSSSTSHCRRAPLRAPSTSCWATTTWTCPWSQPILSIRRAASGG